jgi:hypothetical protein
VGADAGGPRKRLCNKCAKRPKMRRISRWGVCRFDKHNPKAEDVVDILDGKSNKMRSYQKMMKAKNSK